MRNFFTLDGKSSADFNAYISRSNMFDSAEREVEKISIPGRNGDLTIDQGRFSNFTSIVEIYIPSGMREKLDGLRNWLQSVVGYRRYEESYKPEEYRQARFTGRFEVSESDRVGAALTLEFDCMPQRYLKTGEIPVEYTANGSIYNRTLQDAKPLLRVWGNGTVGIGDATLTISGTTAYTDIDCESMDAYYGATNRNGNISGTFPVLKPGTNGIALGTGITKLQITPRWWIL